MQILQEVKVKIVLVLPYVLTTELRMVLLFEQ